MSIPNDPLNDQNDFRDDISLNNIFLFLNRNKKLILQITSAFILISGIYAYTKKKIWQGEFQIVIAKQTSNFNSLNSAANSTGQLKSIIKNLSPNKSLLTEVTILKSQSILMPVFEYVKTKKSDDKLTYKKWLKGSLNIELEDRTSVLNIVYQDTDKSLINPVLTKISKAYQAYSDRSRIRSLNDGLNYLNKQIILYGEDSKNALKKVLNFADKNSLPDINEFKDKSNKIDKNITTSILKASNDLRLIENQIKQFDSFSNNSDKIEYIINSINTVNIRKLANLILETDFKLAKLKTKYLSNDKSIIQALKRKEYLDELIIKEAYVVLETNKLNANNYLKSIYRTPEILAEYQKLINEKMLMRETLTRLENERLLLSLEKAQNKRPWELITAPSTLDYSVAPNKKLLILFGTFFGFLLGSFISYLKEYISDKIYTKDDLKLIFNHKIIAESNNLEIKNIQEGIEIFINEKFEKFSGKDIALIPFGNIPENNIDEVYKNISKVNSSLGISKIENISDAYDYSCIFILIRIGFGTKSKANEFKSKLNLFNNKPKFIILLS